MSGVKEAASVDKGFGRPQWTESSIMTMDDGRSSELVCAEETYGWRVWLRLKLEKTISTLKSTHQFSTSSLEISPTICKIFIDFPLLTNDHQVATLIEEDRKVHLKFDKVFNLIKKHGFRLRGRYLWSARYVAHLNKYQGDLDSTAISKNAETTIMEAKDSLKNYLGSGEENTTRFYRSCAGLSFIAIF